MKRRQFTLIELLVVIVIIGILAGVIMISTSSSIDKANIAKSKVFEESIANDLAANMVSRWKLDQINYPAANQTPDVWGSNHGTLVNGPSLITNDCVSEGCFSFNGSSNYINKDYSSDLNSVSQVTLSCWIKPNQAVNSDFVGMNYAYFFRLYSGNTARFFIYNSSGVVGYSVMSPSNLLGRWSHLVGIYNNDEPLSSKKFRLYLDGKFIGNATVEVSGNIQVTSSSFRISGVTGWENVYFGGLMDDVRVYDAALSSSQIKQNYIAGLNFLLSNGNISKEDYNQRINQLAYNEYE